MGEQRIPTKEPAAVEIGDLVITFPEASSKEFVAWHEDFVVKGNSGDDKERSGKLELLSPTLQPLFTLTLKGLGIYRLTRAPAEVTATGAEGIAKMTARMYCQDLAIAAK